MTVHLLDVNVLVALAWPSHVHHAAARAWFADAHRSGWATCPVTESGFIRVSSNRRVLSDARSPREAAALMREMSSVEGHQFFSDDVSLSSAPEIDFDQVHGYRQITDVHLLVLAARNRATLATFDRALANTAIADTQLLTLLG